MLLMIQGSCVALILLHVCLTTLPAKNFGRFFFDYFGSLISETFYLISDEFQTDISDKNFEHFAETFVPPNKNSTETSMKIVVLLHRQGFTDSTTRK